MKLLLSAIALAVAGTCAHAGAPGPDWMSRDQVARKLKSLGYGNVTGLEADDGHWEGEATKDGTIFELRVDPRDGRILGSAPKDADD